MQIRDSHIIASIDALLKHAIETGLIEEPDRIQKRNELSDLLKVDLGESTNAKDLYGKERFLVDILNDITNYAVHIGLIPSDTTTYRDLFDTRVMGVLTPRQSEVIRRFSELRNSESRKEAGVKKATDYFYALCQASNYIRTDRVQKNCRWPVATQFGDLMITVNLSKPEKDPRDILEAAQQKPRDYPKCELCIENVGYSGRVDHPARQNLRVIPLILGGEQWYFQYSPYVYYNEHCILLSQEHRPLTVDKSALVRMFDFIEDFPHYFLGSNAGLPIVGGSILDHDHYQGGREVFPLDLAPLEYTFAHPDFPQIEAGIVKWPMSVVRLKGKDREGIIQLGSIVLYTWQEYEDRSVDILPYTSRLEDSKTPRKVLHNAVTVTLRRQRHGDFVLNLILRNNRTTPTHPFGIFHPREDLHHIKKENIGVIEAMGMAILPGRLDKELTGIARILSGEIPIPCWDSPSNHCQDVIEETYAPQGEAHMLYKHRRWIDELVSKYSNTLTSQEAKEALRAEVGQRFLQVLLDAGVFKQNRTGKNAFNRFIKACGFYV